MVINQGWNEERFQRKKRGVHALNEVDMISAKMDLLLKKIEESSSKKGIEANQTPDAIRAMETDPLCEVCRGDDHSGNNFPETQEEVNYINNNFKNGNRPNNNNGVHAPSTKAKVWVTIIILVIPLVTNHLLKILC